ncbi:hypothetical protein QQS21_007608 [Conoideocrella luteorostrata]|uniref:Uncharacterized protein n=1 Tax=Conoideocrella luteorostrata TaxID=1105319 RepID=A0AAJ0CKG0_9HYPO|nr:hypothetical protein QQS21_007608 [Conoideocrella luteorostrata]
MPEVRRGSRSIDGRPKPLNTTLSSDSNKSTPGGSNSKDPSTDKLDLQHADPSGPIRHQESPRPQRHVNISRPSRSFSRNASDPPTSPASPSSMHDHPRRSLSYALRPEAPAYYDSRAATRAEYKRRARTLQEYYDDNPHLLPQLPFTWHHGKRRWRLFLFAFLVFVDASAVPIALYYGLHYAGDVEGWIIFAVVTTIWGGPTYLEFAIRTLRLIKKERFYRPLGTDSRWCFDSLTYISVITITAVTALFVVGSAPHIVWLRVLCMPAPAILYCLGGCMAVMMLYTVMGWKAPFRISSTAKGEPVLPAAYYFIEDVVAVNAKAGRPYREALAARYKASPRFQRMLYVQSIFWSIPSVILAAALTVVAVHPSVPATGAYGVCWAVPFLWWGIWGAISVWWCKRDMVRERLEWEADNGTVEKQGPQRIEADGSGSREPIVVGETAAQNAV